MLPAPHYLDAVPIFFSCIALRIWQKINFIENLVRIHIKCCRTDSRRYLNADPIPAKGCSVAGPRLCKLKSGASLDLKSCNKKIFIFRLKKLKALKNPWETFNEI